MTNSILEERVSKKTLLNASDIANMSDHQLDEIIEGQNQKTTSEQLREARIRVNDATARAKTEYLQEKTGLWGNVNSLLYDLNLRSPEKELQRKNDALVRIRTGLDSDIKTVKTVIWNGYTDIINSEKRKLAIDVKISRKEKALEEEKIEYEETARSLLDEDIDEVTHSQLECDLQEAYLNSFTIENEISLLKAEYVLTHKRTEKLRSVLSSQELDLQRLMQTNYDLEGQVQEIAILMRRGVSPAKILSSMEKVYSYIEECERIKNGILRNSYDVSEAISEVRIVTGKAAEENQELYKQNGNLARKINDCFEVEYASIKENLRRT
ncbi:MAG: hypothetical protein ISS25_04175 [Nanoarchaeota archaeon]|nr:hypothetical protein [DPANN group archaeon]MBL7116998.1 hypothetical protein [Nanoarchaeota archaeon]